MSAIVGKLMRYPTNNKGGNTAVYKMLCNIKIPNTRLEIHRTSPSNWWSNNPNDSMFNLYCSMRVTIASTSFGYSGFR